MTSSGVCVYRDYNGSQFVCCYFDFSLKTGGVYVAM